MIEPRVKLIETRKKKGMTQEELASKAGITRSFLANIEGGKYTPSLNVAYSISKVLGVKMEELFFNGDVRKTNKTTLSDQPNPQKEVS